MLYISGGDNVHLKILVPSIAAGAIIGKGGETIAHVQKEAGARVKMSKANDFYPGKFCHEMCLELQGHCLYFLNSFTQILTLSWFDPWLAQYSF